MTDLHFPFYLDRPWIPLLIFPIGFVLWLTTPNRQINQKIKSISISLILRTVIVLLILFALSGTHAISRSSRLTTIFLVDVSQSITPAQRAVNLRFIKSAIQRKRADDLVSVIEFGRNAFLNTAPTDNSNIIDTTTAAVPNDATNLSAAIQLAISSFPDNSNRKIVLLSDGNENIGDSLAVLPELNQEGIQVDIAGSDTYSPTASPEAAINSLSAPHQVSQFAHFHLRALISSTVDQTGNLSLYDNGLFQRTVPIKLLAGSSVGSFDVVASKPGRHRYEVRITAPLDTFQENNRYDVIVDVVGRPSVLYIGDPNENGIATLQHAMSVQGIDLDIKTPSQMPATASALSAYQSILVSDVPASEFSPQQMDAVKTSVGVLGIGFGMIGGPQSFGSGGYAETPIEQALPVYMKVPKSRVQPQVAIIVVLDASGSMTQIEDGAEKVQLAARAAVQLMSSLRPTDLLGVNAVTTESTVVVPLGSSTNSQAARDDVQGLYAGGGGIYCYQGLKDAYALILESHAPVRHVILCADTDDSEQQQGCVALAKIMQVNHHITTTVCGIGSSRDKDVPFQIALAKSGGGQSFVVERASDLNNMFQRDVRHLQQTWYREAPIRGVGSPTDTLTSGLDFGTSPVLLGYDLSVVKPQASTDLSTSPGNDPLLAHWQFGLGRSYAFLSDDRPHWAQEWLKWSGYNRFWSQVIRWSARQNVNSDFLSTVRYENGRGHIVVDSTLKGISSRFNSYEASVISPDMTVTETQLNMISPGRFEGDFPANDVGDYEIRIEPVNRLYFAKAGERSFTQNISMIVPYSPEYRSTGNNYPLLSRLANETGGKFQPDPSRVFDNSVRSVSSIQDKFSVLLFLAALLYIVEIAMRQVAIRRSKIKNVFGTAGKSPKSIPVPKANTAKRHKSDVMSAVPQSSILSRTIRTRLSDAADENPFPQVAKLRQNPGSQESRNQTSANDQRD